MTLTCRHFSVSNWIVNSNHILDLQYDIEESIYTLCYNIFLFI